jgi:hypothetical protein
MKKDSKKVEKLLDAFFAHSTVHPQPVLNIIKEMRSTYDGDYPYFELVYDATNHNNGNEMDKLIESVTGYTGLREGRDYWLGVTWQYLEV